MKPVFGCLVVLVLAGVGAVDSVHGQAITYRIHPDIYTELQDRYPDDAEEYWMDAKAAIREGLNAWATVNPGLVFTPTQDDHHHILIEWVDSERAWGVEYHDAQLGSRIGIDFDSPEPDVYGASLMNPDIITFVVAHEFGHAIGMGHSPREGHLMYGTANPRPDRTFDDLGVNVPRVFIEDHHNIGGAKIDVAFHLQGYTVHDVEVIHVDDIPYLVAATGDAGLHVLNMTTPDQPSLVWSQEDFSVDIWSLEGWPYLVQMYADGFRVWNMSDPSNIVQASVVRTTILDAVLIEVDDTPLVITISRGLIQQYDLSNPNNTRLTGAHSDDFNLLGVERIVGVAHLESTYLRVDASFDGMQNYLIQADRSPVRAWTDLDFEDIHYFDAPHEEIDVGGAINSVIYWQNQLILYEGDNPTENVIGRLLGYTVWVIDTLRVGGDIYAVVAVDSDGILGLSVGSESAGGWTVG